MSAILLSVVAAIALAPHVGAGAAGARAVVVAELFTSEGCSSCPPADDLLRQLVASQPVDGVEVVALSEHVDYWDQLGWRDPFSSPLFSKRQSEYDTSVFRSNNIYTPQLVVDGTFECLGSDADVVRRTLLKAAQGQKATVMVSAELADERIAAVVHADMPATVARRGPADVMIAVTEDGLATPVRSGENSGRTLRHTAVVRSLTTAGTLTADDHELSTSAHVSMSTTWNAANIRVVSFIQDRATRRIVGAGAAALKRSEKRR